MEIKKAIIPTAGLGTRFLPLSKIVPKELWPLVDRPVVERIIEEAAESGIKEIIFVFSPGARKVLDYLASSPKIEKILKERGKEKVLAEFKEFEEKFKNIVFKYVFQKEPMGDGHAILQAAKLVKSEPVACLFSDDVVDSKIPCLSQMIKVFKTCQKPVLSLYRLPKEKILPYAGIDVEKIANRFFKIKNIIEKPKLEEIPSELTIVGKYILTPEVFEYLKKAKPSEKGEIILAEVFQKMLLDGKVIYGYEFEGRWLECGDKLKWLKSHIYLSLKDPRFGSELKSFLKEIKAI